MKSVLYLGCPSAERAETERLLGTADVHVLWADTVAYALAELQRRDVPVLVDLSRGAAALQTARELRTQRPSTLMFAVVDARRPDLTTEAVLAGMADVFARPLGGRRVASAIDRETRIDAPPSAADRADQLYAHSTAMRDVLALVSRAASMRAGVLISGERGTGRQLTARAIHAAQEAKGPFVVIDCASYSGEELESALFGTTARGHGDVTTQGLERVSRRGVLHEAAGGTLYLKNLAEAPSRAQARLARLLRDREALLIDTDSATELDVRPMAGVDPGFDSVVAEGRVRDDLFRRISVIRIEMPPLRSRREDIPALANYFLRQVCAELRVPPKTLSRPALSLIAALPWHGNAVELKTLIESVVGGLQGGRGIGLEDVLAHVRLDGGSVVFTHGGTLRQARARFEREYIAAVLEQHHGRISEAAKALGIQRTNLYRKMRALRVARSHSRS
jgi:two-component system nitrogen regulation response regulator NtrX